MAEDQLVETESEWTLARRQAFLRLPIEQRRQQLAEQAKPMVDHYTRQDETSLRQLWQGGDVVEDDR
jgi:hypothetical protein